MSSVSVAGLGLMGGSLVRDLSRMGWTVRCWSPEEGERTAAARLPGVRVARSPAELVEGGLALVLATPLGAVRELMLQVPPPAPGDGGWIQDLASLQGPPLGWAAEAGLERRYVSAHPLTGGEASGFTASRTGLYRDAPVFLSHSGAADAVQEEVASFWEGLGGHPRWVDAERHDERMGWVSHLPQVVSTHLAGALEDAGHGFGELGPGGRDMVRLAGSSPVMWRDLLAHSPAPVAGALRVLADRLRAEADRLEAGEADRFARELERSRSWRSV